MATTHVVSLFLPFTVDFHEKEQSERRPSPPARVPSKLSNELPLRTSTPSLLTGQTPGATPSISEAEELFTKFGLGSQKSHLATPGDPHSLVRSDGNLSEFARQAVFNQPKSRAGPLPSDSLQDFAKAYEEVQRQRTKKQSKTSPKSRATSRGGSSDRSFSGKEWTVEAALNGNGGLTNAMREGIETHGYDITWVGTIGFPTDSLSDTLKDDISDKLLEEYQSSVVYVGDSDFKGCYKGFCKTILWPHLHYSIPDHPKSKAYADHSWEFYVHLNQAFADKVVASYKRGDTVWVHDYHLLLVPNMIRKQIPDAKIGFFLHTAFPSSEVFRCLAKRRELLEGMLGANLVAFQIDEYAQHFLQTCSRILTVETTIEGVQLENHFVNVTSRPIGINLAATQAARRDEEVKEWIDIIQAKYRGKWLIVANDKLDNIRGVRNKLLSFELLLNKHPELREKIVMIQVAISTNENSELLTTISDIVSRIDSVHSTLAHQPLVLLKQDIAFPQYLALLTVADALMITSLRDGMDLNAHEFIICQDGQFCEDKRHGPLILSEFTGSAAVFGGFQLSVNPWDFQQQAAAIKTALEMSAAEKERRWSELNTRVVRETGGRWAQDLTERLEKVYAAQNTRDSSSVPRLAVQKVAEAYKNAGRRVFILDYEGTLAPHRTHAGIPLSSPQRVLDALNELTVDSKNDVYVMSGRTPRELESHFRTVPQLGLIAENGCFMRESGSEKRSWTSFPDMEAVGAALSTVKGILSYYYERLENSYIEERNCSLLFRFDKVEDQEAATRTAGECADHINGACSEVFHVRAVPIHQAVLIEMTDFSKRSAAAHILDQRRISEPNQAVDLLFVAGDDREDEVVFRWANELGQGGAVKDVFTVSVGKRNTEALSTLTQGTTGLLSVLGKLSKISADQAPRDYFNVKPR